MRRLIAGILFLFALFTFITAAQTDETAAPQKATIEAQKL